MACNRSVLTLVGVIVSISAFLFPNSASVATIQEQFDSYFADMMKTVQNIATSSAMKKTALSPVDAYFLTQLKKHQPIYSLIRTNSKGVIVNEVIRTEKPSRDYRDVAAQPWFKYVLKKKEPYYGLLKEENGRYHLFWAVPLLKTDKSGSEKFLGAVASKIDLWDCFHKQASDLNDPFLVRLGKLSLYSNKWEKTTGWTEQALTIPGIDKITVRYKPTPTTDTTVNPATLALQKDTAVLTTPVFAIDSSKNQKKGWPFSFKIGKYRIMALGLVLLIIPGVLLFRFYFWFKNWRITQRIKREDRF